MARKPKPLSRQISEGDTRKRGKKKLKQLAKLEAQPTRGLPECPEHVIGRARDAWAFWKAELIDMHLDARPDAMMLEGACVNYARAVQADQIVEKEGAIVEDVVLFQGVPTGFVRIKKHPAISISNSAWSQVKAFCSEFGLSPVSRTRLAIEKGEKPGENLGKILTQPRLPKQKPLIQ